MGTYRFFFYELFSFKFKGLLTDLFATFLIQTTINFPDKFIIQFAIDLDLHSSVFLYFQASSSPGRPLLVGYWGQNSAGPANGPANNERPLKDVCESTKYDVLAVAFVDSFWDVNNEGT